MTVTLADLLKDSAYRLDQFKPEHIAALEAGITLKEAGKAAAEPHRVSRRPVGLSQAGLA